MSWRVNGLTVEVQQGDLTAQDVDAIVNGMLLPLLLPILIVLASDKRIMGRYANTRLFNVASGAVFVFLSLVTLAFLASIFFPGLFRG